MSKVTRKLLLSVLSVVLTVVALGTTTFAWFTITNVASVQPFEAQVLADAGIEIALGDLEGADPSTLNWVTTLTTEDILAYIASKEATMGPNFRFDHVTSENGYQFSTLTSSGVQPTSSGYLRIPLHFRSNNASGINWTSVSLTSGAAIWNADVAFTTAQGVSVNPGSEVSVDAASAVRISIHHSYQDETETPVNDVVVYERPASEYNVVLGSGGDLRGLNLAEEPAEQYEGANGAMNYFFKKNNELPAGIDQVTTVSTVTSISEERIIDMTDGQMASAGNEYYGAVTVFIWLEGWDPDAYNSILDRMITVSMSFQGYVEPESGE